MKALVPDWDRGRALATAERLRGCRVKRPKGKIVYEILGAERIWCGWGIRIRRSPQDKGYVLCHNAINEMVVINQPQEG